MAASARRVGAETSKTRDTLLDHVEKMMLDEGYASVTYRALASAAGVTPSLVSTTSRHSTTFSLGDPPLFRTQPAAPRQSARIAPR